MCSDFLMAGGAPLIIRVGSAVPMSWGRRCKDSV